MTDKLITATFEKKPEPIELILFDGTLSCAKALHEKFKGTACEDTWTYEAYIKDDSIDIVLHLKFQSANREYIQAGSWLRLNDGSLEEFSLPDLEEYTMAECVDKALLEEFNNGPLFDDD